MNCPACLQIMENRDERHHVHPDSYRMNLHCCNYNYSKKRSNCPGDAHMGVIVPPSYANQEWICDHYNFIIPKDNKRYILRAIPSTPIIKFIDNKWQLVYNKYKFTQILTSYDSEPLIQVPFIPISTNNDMHLEVAKIFERYLKLIIFT